MWCLYSGHKPNIPLLFTFEPTSSKIEIESVSGVEHSRYSLVYLSRNEEAISKLTRNQATGGVAPVRLVGLCSSKASRRNTVVCHQRDQRS